MNSSSLGPASLFIGVESESWSLADFQTAAQNAKSLGISALIVKVADGVFEWYRDIGEWEAVLDTIEGQGVKAVPYIYCYGNKYGALSGEINVLKAIMEYAGVVVADMEAEWNGHADWGATLAGAGLEKLGHFGVTTWADPNLQDWQGVIGALKGCVDFWLPQVYTDYLASVYREQFAGLPLAPVFNLGTDVGPNDLLQNVQTAQGGPVAFWEYQAAVGPWAATVKQIMATQGGTTMLQITDPFAATHFKEISETNWLCTTTGYTVIDGILDYWRKTNGAFRLPLTSEIYNVIPNGSFQIFEGGVLTWDPQLASDNPGQGPVYAMHLDKDTPGLRKLMALAGLAVPPVTADQVASALTAVKSASTSLAVAQSSLEPAHP